MVNLLEMVLPMITNVVPPCEFEWRTCTGDVVNDFGVVEVSYSPWKKCIGSVQPMNANMMEMQGLDKSKVGILVWGSVHLGTVGAGRSHPDQVRWNGKLYTVERDTDWHMANGWTAVACVEVVEG